MTIKCDEVSGFNLANKPESFEYLIIKVRIKAVSWFKDPTNIIRHHQTSSDIIRHHVTMIYYDILFINQNYLNQLTLQMFSNSDTLSTLLKIQIEDGATSINVSSSYKVAPSYNIVMEIHEHKWRLNMSFLHVLLYSFTFINGFKLNSMRSCCIVSISRSTLRSSFTLNMWSFVYI